MASWPEIRDTLESLQRTERLTDEVLRVTILLIDDQGKDVGEDGQAYVDWDVYVTCEVPPRKDGGPGGLEFVSVDAPVGTVGQIDLMSVVGHLGQLVPGSLGYVQGTEWGRLSVRARVPAALIDVNHPEELLFLLYNIGGAAREVIPELGGNGRFSSRAEQIRRSAWHAIRHVILNDGEFEVERDRGQAFIFWVNGTDRRLRMFAGLNEPGPGEHYVTFEYALGAAPDVDMQRAAEAAAATTGGLVCDDGFVSLRISQHLTAITPMLLKASLAQLLIAAEKYLQ